MPRSVPAATGFFEVTVAFLFQYSLTLLLSQGFLILSQHLHIASSYFFPIFFSCAVIRHPQYISAFSPFPSLSLSLFTAPIYPVVIMEKSVIVLRGADNTFSLIKDIYGM